jgi:hypothetical protein
VERVVITLEHKTRLFGTIRGDTRKSVKTGPTTISTGAGN